jgi:hypothetical protein
MGAAESDAGMSYGFCSEGVSIRFKSIPQVLISISAVLGTGENTCKPQRAAASSIMCQEDTERKPE